MSAIIRVLIAGGGPAGALCAERLASAGFSVTLFEERPGWEKPCGGGVTWKTLQRYPFLLEGGVEKKLIRKAELIAADGRRVALELSRPLAIYSRATLNSFLLRRAAQAGCTVIRQRALAGNLNGRARLRTVEDEFDADFLIVATGARNALRLENAAGAADWKPAPRDLELTAGFYLPGDDDRIRVQFLHNFEGYLWSFPRPDHLGDGICGKMEQNSSAALKEKLHRFLESEKISASGGTFYSHLLPSLARPSWKHLALAGPRWRASATPPDWSTPSPAKASTTPCAPASCWPKPHRRRAGNLRRARPARRRRLRPLPAGSRPIAAAGSTRAPPTE
jgi:flavin-dependent dehydrogenase